MQSKLTVIFALLLSLVMLGCVSGGDDVIDKQDLLGKADDLGSVCMEYGLDSGCDVCAEFGFYEDGECDLTFGQGGLCQVVDKVDCSCVGNAHCLVDRQLGL